MARRKPQHVQRNRQQNTRQRDATERSSTSEDAADQDASNEPLDVIIINEDDETDGSMVDQVEAETDDPPPSKRPRVSWRQSRRPARGRIGSSAPVRGRIGSIRGRIGRGGRGPTGWTPWAEASDLNLQVGALSQLTEENEPWNDKKRADALWLSVPIEAIPRLAEALRVLEDKGEFAACGSVERIGLVVCGEWGTAENEPSRVALRDLYHDWGWGKILLEDDIVTMEVQRTADEGNMTYECRVGVDWRGSVNSPHGALSQVMAWLLYHSKGLGMQWHYAYPNEIDAMYKPTKATPFDAHDVFAKIDVKRQLQRDVSNVPAHVTAPTSALLPTLRDYQRAALSWMLAREGVQSEQNNQDNNIAEAEPLDCLSRCVRFRWPRVSKSKNSIACPSDQLLYDIFSGTFCIDDRKESELPMTNIRAIRGGILAEEMGLGKTVEVIALVLSNPSPNTVPEVISEVTPMEDSDFMHACVCGSDEECDSGWVQCDVCYLWHHQLCTGFDPDSAGRFTVSGTSSLPPNSFVCFHCQIEQHIMLSCKTTLIVSPESIHDQWESELKRHVKPDALRLLRYPGVKALRSRLQGKGPSAEWRILASLGVEMASYDIVLTTYEALASDLHHVPTSIGKERRSSTRQKRKKYAYIGSPLVFLKFWRVCMDEAQVGVENTQLQAALTVAELCTEMKWIVTGTPFSTQLTDIYGCFAFLRLEPYCDEAGGMTTFRSEIEHLFTRGAPERLYDLLLWDGRSSRCGGGLLWRTNKRDVLSQLGLPAQSDELVWCRFSNVERLFYDRQEAEVIKALKQERERRRKQFGEDYNEEDEVGENVWYRVLLLRQVCCHPQVGQILRTFGATNGRDRRRPGRGRRNNAHTNSAADGEHATMNVLTMDDFLLQLLEKCRRECEEAQRKLIAAHNGHASLALINDDFSTAIVKYMISVQLIRSNWEEFRADLLPRLHILDNLATCVRRALNLDASLDQGGQEGETSVTKRADGVESVRADVDMEQEVDSAALNGDGGDNPKQVSLMPDLGALLRTITDDGVVMDGADVHAITKECEALEAAASKIRRFYLLEGEYKHGVARQQFENVRNTIETKLYHPTARSRASTAKDAMLCSSNMWWLEMFAFLKQLSGRENHVAQMVNRLRAHLYALGTPWSSSFADRFHNADGLALALMSELITLHKKRNDVIVKLLSQSQRNPTKTEIEMSGNCKKCREGRDGPVCWHCKFYKEFEGYKQHLLGVDNTVVTATTVASWAADLLVDDEDTSETGIPSTTTTASTSLIVDIFRQLSSGARLLLRENRLLFSPSDVERLTQLFQDGMQQESELWASLLREWNRAKKLFQSQHQRLGSLDELEMAQMKIRLRLPGEVVETATDKLYKLMPYEVPIKIASFEAERVVAEAELKQKQSELRYLKHMQATNTTRGENGSTTENPDETTADTSDKICVVCLEDIHKQRVAMLPCAHKTCLRCSERLANHLRSSRSIRCPTCRRIFPVDQRREVENDADRAREMALAARTATASSMIADSSVQLVRSGFSSKIDAILRRVRALAIDKPDLKALVFTQWQDMMGVIAAALQLNGIKCFTYTSKKQFHRVLHDFKLFPDACVLALPFKIGANGLNIIEATEVLLVEPLLITSIEAQAINRVHRIGQTEPTRVHRFVVDNSVEERIYWLGRSNQRQVHEENEGKEEDEDDNMEFDDSVVVGRQEKEKLTLGQLQALLNGRAMVASEETSNPEGTIPVNASDHPFWRQCVEMNDRKMTRREVRELLDRRRAAERRAGLSSTESISSEPVTLLIDRNVNLTVAHELLHLKISAEDDSTSNEGLKELVGMAQQRIGEELRVWRSQ